MFFICFVSVSFCDGDVVVSKSFGFFVVLGIVWKRKLVWLGGFSRRVGIGDSRRKSIFGRNFVYLWGFLVWSGRVWLCWGFCVR